MESGASDEPPAEPDIDRDDLGVNTYVAPRLIVGIDFEFDTFAPSVLLSI